MDGFRNFIGKIFRRRKNVALTTDDVLLRALLNGETIDRKMALSIPTVEKAVDMICNTVAMIPIKLYQENDGKIEEVPDDNRVFLLNDDTKDTMTGVQFKKALVEDYLLGKGGYAYIKKRLNKVMSLHYVKEDQISIKKNDDPIFKSYEISSLYL